MVFDVRMNNTSNNHKRFNVVIFILLLLILNGCASLPTGYEQLPSYVMEDTQDTKLGHKVAPVVTEHPEQSGFYILSLGMDAFVARIALIDAAERSLDIQYYIWHNDMTGNLLVDRLLLAADRGVRVRVLLDDMDTSGKDRGLMMLDAHPNIEIRLYNPFANRGSRVMDFTTDLSRVNRRMHNKSLTADNQATIIGGRNIGNEYFGAVSHAEFSDLDVLAIGPVVKDVSTMFDSYWNSKWVVPVRAFESEQPITEDALAQARIKFSQSVAEAKGSPYVEALRKSGVLKRLQYRNMKFYWGRAVLIYDAPSKVDATKVSEETHLAPKLSNYVKQATQEILIVSPYFVPGDRMVESLGELVKKGIRVRILTNSLAANDVGVVHAGYMRYRVGLLKRGIELYEFKATHEKGEEQENKKWTGSSNASLHAKTLVLDRRVMFVGSFNLDPRSVALNTEMGVLFESPEVASMLGDGFDNNLIHKAYRLKLNTIPEDETESGFEEYTLEWITIENGKEVSFKADPETSVWQRFMAGFLSIIVIESFL